MNGQSLLAVFVSAIVSGMVLPCDGRAQDAKTSETPAYGLVPKSAKRIKATLNFEVKSPKLLADEWTLYVAELPELPGQIDVRTTLSPRGKTARELSDAGRPVQYVRIPAVGNKGGQEVALRVDYEAILLERRLEAREADAPTAPAVAPLDAKTRRLELANGHHFDYRSPHFAAWLDENKLHREKTENEVDFARRAFLVVRKGIQHFEGEKVEHLASRVCEAGKSDYAGITAVYVAALRANGIPARALAGRVVIYEEKPTKTSWAHAKAEFFANGIGWVPADVAGAIRTNKSPEGLEFFGSDSAEFLTCHLDTDLVVDTYFGPKTHEWLLDPSFWVKGAGNFDGLKAKVAVNVEVEPVDLAEILARKPTRPSRRNRPGSRRAPHVDGER